MKSGPIVLVIFVIGGGLVAAGLANLGAPPEGEASSRFPISADYLEFETYSDLRNESDLVVVGTVVRAVSVGSPLGEGRAPFTLFEVSTVEVLAGELAPVTRIYQLGARIGPREYIAVNDPLMAAGEEVILFLKRVREARDDSTVESDGFPLFGIVGGPQGRLVREGNSFYPPGKWDAFTGSVSQTGGPVSLEAIRSEVQGE